MAKLIESEKQLLGRVTSAIKSRFVNVRLWNSSMYTITVKASENADENKVPFVLIHGFAAGWCAFLA